jgi:hypothetical protein
MTRTYSFDNNTDQCFFRVSPPVLPIQFGYRQEQMPIIRQGIFMQFEPSQKMNGVFIALLLRQVISDIENIVEQDM